MFHHDLLIPLRRGAESEKGPQLAVSYISRDETGGRIWRRGWRVKI